MSRLCAQLWTKAEKNADAVAVLFSINLELRKGERLREKTNGTSSGCSDPLAALNLDPWNRSLNLLRNLIGPARVNMVS